MDMPDMRNHKSNKIKKMSIWEDCKQYEALPFYGFPVKPSFKDGIIIFHFPEGYKPSGSQTKEVAKNLAKRFNGQILEASPKWVRVAIDPAMIDELLGELFYNDYMDCKDFD